MRTSFAFTKLIVHDLEKMAAFYSEVYDLAPRQRFDAEIGSEPIDEFMLGAEGETGSLILLQYVERPRPSGEAQPARQAKHAGEVILGFTTDDLPALLDRVRAAGGGIHADIKEVPDLKLRVAFATDPEGHLAELVQMLA